ncbi:unnamed protein product [Caenorhabditis angaria]|uniref:Glutathione S-transferase kappa n=1 Tax=Caenorhabditis angaria TaxID=860376 RepID=A0A9P1N5V0_9PELO|nr:unnamed protein product [Caenorhabditis angaria]
MSKSIRFFFDVISPYSYFGFSGITKQKNLWKTPIELKPILFGGIVKGSGNKGMPLAIPVKEKYMKKDLPFSAQYWGIPFRMPKDYTKLMMTTSSIVPQKFLVATKIRDGEDKMIELTSALCHRFYAYNKPIFTIEQVEEVLRDLQISNSEELVKLSKSDEVKEVLKQNTKEALDNGCFGAPWTHIIDDSTGNVIQTVFGSDRFPQIAHFVGEEFHGPKN